MMARTLRFLTFTCILAAAAPGVRGAVTEVEDFTGCKLPNGRAVLPIAGTAQAANGTLLKLGATARLVAAPTDDGKPLPADQLVDAERKSQDADLQYLLNDSGSLWAFSGYINDVGARLLSSYSGKKLPEAGKIPKTSRNYAAGELQGATEGFVYLLKTTDGKWALVRVLEKTDAAMVVQYVLQPDGTTTFDIPVNKPIPYERPLAAEPPPAETAPATQAALVAPQTLTPFAAPDLLTGAPVETVAPAPAALPTPARIALGPGDHVEKGVIVLVSPSQGDKAIDSSVDAFAKQRWQMIQRRLEIITAPATTPEEVDRKSQAMYDLVNLHADEAAVADALVAQISFLNPRSPSREFSPESLHPAYGALVHMGTNATTAAIKGLRKLDLDAPGDGIDSAIYKVGLLGRVVRAVEGDDVAEFLFKSAAEKETDPKRKAVFEYLLNNKP